MDDLFTIFRLRRGGFGHLVWLADAGCGMVWGLEILENKGFRAPGAFGARMRCSEHKNFCHPKNGKRGENKGRESWPHYLPPVFRYFFAPFLAQILKTPKKGNIDREGVHRGHGKLVNRKNGKTLQK